MTHEHHDVIVERDTSGDGSGAGAGVIVGVIVVLALCCGSLPSAPAVARSVATARTPTST
jgi:hypothetical protein